MKRAIVVSFALLLTAAASAQTWFKGSLDEAVVKAKRENKLVILDFYSGG